jgi:hypothetical protein
VTPQPLDYLSSNQPRRGRRWLAGRFSRWHIWTAGVLWLGFTVLTLLIVLKALDKATQRPMIVAATTAGTVLGPMTGAISRDFQGCCLEFSLSLLPYCLGALAVALAVQLIVPPRGWPSRTLRLLAWAAGWFVWFAGGIVSFGHALS